VLIVPNLARGAVVTTCDERDGPMKWCDAQRRAQQRVLWQEDMSRIIECSPMWTCRCCGSDSTEFPERH